MKFKFNNLAQISEAIIEEDNLVVIVGDNGTGKTLLLESVVAAKKILAEKVQELSHQFLQFNSISLSSDIEQMYTFINSVMDGEDVDEDFGYHEKNFKIQFDLDDNELLDFLKSQITSIYPEIEEFIAENILLNSNSDFKFEVLDFPKEFFSDRELNVDITVNRLKGNSSMRSMIFISLEKEGRRVNRHRYITNSRYPGSDKRPERSYFSTIEEFDLASMLENLIVRFLISTYIREEDIVYLPSERNSYLDSTTSKLLKGNYSSKDFKLRYSEYLFSKAYLEYKEIKSILVESDSVSESLESMLEGKLKYDDNDEIVGLERHDGKFIKRELFSTKLNKLIPYTILESSVGGLADYIIEEPEANLSLRSMKELTKYLREKLTNRNIFVTTHSDVFFQRLNNMIVNNKEISSRVYEIYTLDHTSKLKEVVRSENGYEIQLFNEELDLIYDETLDIQEKQKSNIYGDER